MYSEIKTFQIILQNWKVLVPWAAVTPYFVRDKSIMTVAFFITRISSLSKGGTVRESEVPIANASSDFFRKCSLEQLGILMRKVAISTTTFYYSEVSILAQNAIQIQILVNQN